MLCRAVPNQRADNRGQCGAEQRQQQMAAFPEPALALALRPADGELQLLRGLLRRAEGGRYLPERALPAQGVPYLVCQAVREPPPGGAARRQRA